MISIINTQGTTSAVLIPLINPISGLTASLVHKNKTGKRWKNGVPSLQSLAKQNV